MKKKLAVLTLALSAAMMLSFGAFAEDEHTTEDQTLVEHDENACMTGEPYNIIEEQKLTCEQDGIYTYRYKCMVNEGQFHEQVVTVPATGHDWASEQGFAEWGRMTVQPTCTQEGQAIDYCLNCGEEREVYRTIEKLPHVFETKVVDVEANCDHPGKYHLECKYCGTPEVDEKGNIIYYEIPLDTEYHNTHKTWDEWVVEKAPTCAEAGKKVRWCKICGAKEEKELPALEPVFELTKKEVVDCYTARLTWTCKNCGGKVDGHQYTEEKEINSHVFKYTEEYLDEQVEPTCEEDGYRVYKCVYYDEVEGHDGDETAKVKIVDLALGHDWGAWLQRHGVNEQGNEYGYWLRSCKRCGKTQEYVGAEAPAEYGKNGWVNESGKISYYKQDVLQKDMTGVYAYNDGMFFVTEGTIDSGANGLNLNEGTWYFLANGQIQFGHDGFAEYDNNWFMIKDGMLDENANGLYDYDGGKFLFAAGKLRSDVSGLWQNPADGEWYYLADGQVVSHTGVVEYDGAFFYVANGKLASSFNGTIEYDGSTFKVVAGQLY